MTTNNNDMFADAARDVLADQCTPHVVRAIEEGGRTAEATTALWEQLEATGLTPRLAGPCLDPLYKGTGLH